jgi:hypothetical protein
MHTRQVSVFVENKKGRLADVTQLLDAAGINIRALYLADTADFGVLRLIVNDSERCLRVLKESDFVAQETDVLAIEVEDRPGGLNRVLRIIQANELNIEYMYAFVEKKVENAVVVFKFDDPDKAEAVLKENGIPVLSAEATRNL